uniref:Uncharacterized protein n=1 Tax=Oryza nivara TaxID=4536 RepID=A0A0E0IIJ4_ORYNI
MGDGGSAGAAAFIVRGDGSASVAEVVTRCGRSAWAVEVDARGGSRRRSSRAVDENTSASAVLTNPTALRLLCSKHFARLPKDASATTAPVGRTR